MHELYAADEVRDAVVERWGAEVAPGGRVDRAAVARHAFADPEERAWLEGLLWPRVGARVAAFREDRRCADPPPRGGRGRDAAAVRGRHGGVYDATIAVIADEEVRARARAARGHEAVDERAARQLTQEEKAAPGDVRRAQRRHGRGARGRAVRRP